MFFFNIYVNVQTVSKHKNTEKKLVAENPHQIKEF